MSDAGGKVTLPADLQGLLRLDYTQDAATAVLADHLEKELRRSQAILDLLDDTSLDDYIPASKLKTVVCLVAGSNRTMRLLSGPLGISVK